MKTPAGLIIPAKSTLLKYGLTEKQWLEILERQGWKCPICLRPNQRWNIDHEHVYGWKRMDPERRRRYVRGILCVRCNWRFVHSTIPADMARRIADYLTSYEARRDK